MITARLGTNNATASLIVTPPPALLSLALSGTAIGQGTVMPGNVVTLSAPAPAGGMVVALGNNRPSQLQVPATINVPAGASSATFDITAFPGTLDTIGTITASLNGVTRAATLNLVANYVYDLKLGAVSVTAGATLGANRVELNLPAVYGGVLVTLSSSNPAVAVPASVLIPAGASFGTFSLSTQLVTNGFVAQVTATAGGRSRAASLTVTAAALSSITAGATSATGGNSITGNLLRLTLPAPTGGVNILLTSSDPAALTVPSSMLVPAGQTQVAFPISTNLISVNKIVTITAAYAGVSRTVQVTVNACKLRTFTLSPSSRRGPGVTTANTLQLNLPAPTGGAAVTITSTNPALAAVPAAVVVPAGATQITFPITVGTVTTSTVVTIRATFGGVALTANLTVTP